MGKMEFAILFIILPVVSARQNATVHAHSISVSMPSVPGFLQKDDPCACSYKGKCSCEGALEFMSCIQQSCESGNCKCIKDGRNHFQRSCQSMAEECPGLGMECSQDTATCNGESVGWSEDGKHLEQEGQEEQQDETSEQQQAAEQQQRPTDSKGLGEQLESDDGEDLPAGWEKAWSEGEGRYYYANRKTGESLWTKPAMQSAPPSDKNERTTNKAPIRTKQGGHQYVRHDHYKDKVKKLHSHTHHIFAKGIIAAVVVLSLTIAFATSADKTVEKNTWATMDMVIVTFLALAWFYVTMHLLEFHKLSGWAKVFMHMGIAVFLLLVSSLVSFLMQKKGGENGVAIFNSVFNNILLWCFAGFGSTVQQLYKHSAFFVLLATLGLMIFFAVLALFWYYAVGKFTHKEWSADTINMLTGGALAAGTVLWVHMLIAGGYHTVEDPRPTKPAFAEVVFMNCFSLVWIAVALIAGPRVQKLNEQHMPYWKKRAVDSLVVFVGFLPYYSCVLSFGHLVIDNLGYDTGAIEARLYLAVFSTLIGMGLIVLCSKVKHLESSGGLSSTLIGLGGFMTGTAWANLLNNSINMMVEGDTHPFKDKLVCISSLTAVIFPVYFYYFKPLVEAKMLEKVSPRSAS